MSFIAVEFVNGIRKEDVSFIVTGVLKYKSFFRASEGLLWLDSHCWTVALNIAAHAWIRPSLAASLNIMSFVLALFMISTHW
eukprot:CAMPEP_0179464770 /NCGR_PEP_ID=MMETSP0799-20121207/46502_1 /TAXON_ID=46947 /ORGANISM="Geminigera cryophila, Strain CCMP2564" /LENGTH=81 /DNA_ID=CAMNT_0021268717 /DNA_START=332 /DNA_END=574 /DNA_ORIENTATION=+